MSDKLYLIKTVDNNFVYATGYGHYESEIVVRRDFIIASSLEPEDSEKYAFEMLILPMHMVKAVYVFAAKKEKQAQAEKLETPAP